MSFKDQIKKYIAGALIAGMVGISSPENIKAQETNTQDTTRIENIAQHKNINQNENQSLDNILQESKEGNIEINKGGVQYKVKELYSDGFVLQEKLAPNVKENLIDYFLGHHIRRSFYHGELDFENNLYMRKKDNGTSDVIIENSVIHEFNGKEEKDIANAYKGTVDEDGYFNIEEIQLKNLRDEQKDIAKKNMSRLEDSNLGEYKSLLNNLIEKYEPGKTMPKDMGWGDRESVFYADSDKLKKILGGIYNEQRQDRGYIQRQEKRRELDP